MLLSTQTLSFAVISLISSLSLSDIVNKKMKARRENIVEKKDKCLSSSFWRLGYAENG